MLASVVNSLKTPRLRIHAPLKKDIFTDLGHHRSLLLTIRSINS